MEKIAGMIEVGDKEVTRRMARAKGSVKLSKEVTELIGLKRLPKGDLFENARVAGVMAAKRTHELIPACHPLRITGLKLNFETTESGIDIYSEVSATDRTGVEMEAMTAVCMAALTIYDMCKMFDRSIEIKDIYLLEKTGGKSGNYLRG